MDEDLRRLEDKVNSRMDMFEIRLKQHETSRAIDDLANDFSAFKLEVQMSFESLKKNILGVIDSLDELKSKNSITPDRHWSTSDTVDSCSNSPRCVDRNVDNESLDKLVTFKEVEDVNGKNLVLDPLLQKINTTIINIDENQRSEYVKAFEELYFGFRAELNKTDPLFETYQKKINTGSHSIKTRVGIPNEFDVNICIKLPGELINDVEFKNCTLAGYIQIKTSMDSWSRLKKNQVWERCKSVEKWTDGDGYLLEDKLRKWMESKVQNVFTNLGEEHILAIPNNNNRYKLATKKSGPAFTLLVEKLYSSIKFDVDLVPSIVFKYPKWPCNVKVKFTKQFKSDEWFAVAKPLSTENEERRFWRPSFALQEIEILSSSYHLKSALRLLKALRDKNQLTYIPTYYINTLFMWKKLEKNEDYWAKSLGVIFMEMLQTLEDAMTKEKILSYWNQQQNLLDNLKKNQLKDASARLKGIIKTIQKNPQDIEKLFGINNSL